jgi:hypothetical protein
MKLIPPKLIQKDLTDIDFRWHNLQIQIEKELLKTNSQLLNISHKLGIDYLVIGSINLFQSTNSYNTETLNYLIDIKAKKIINIKQINHNLYASDTLTKYNSHGLAPSKIKAYQKVLKGIDKMFKESRVKTQNRFL